MELQDVEISGKIRNSAGEEFRVVGIDYVGTVKKRGPLITLNTSQVLDLNALKAFEKLT